MNTNSEHSKTNKEKQMTIFNYYNPPPQVGLRCTSPSLAQQQYTEECNINQILQKFTQTGILDTIGPGVYADLGDSSDYRESLEIIKNAEQMFQALPSHIRDRFQNDPAQYLDFVHDEKNLAEGQELGIFTQSITIPNKNAENGDNVSAQTT